MFTPCADTSCATKSRHHAHIAVRANELCKVLTCPFAKKTGNHCITVVCRTVAEGILQAWEWPSDVASNFHEGFLTFQPVAIICKMCSKLFVVGELLDKNSSEFVAMCPKLYHMLAMHTFQFTESSLLCEGLLCKTTADVSAGCEAVLYTIYAGCWYMCLSAAD